MDLGFVRIAGAALAMSVHEECLQWTRALAVTMKEVDEATAAGLRAKMATMEEALARVGREEGGGFQPAMPSAHQAWDPVCSCGQLHSRFAVAV